MHLLTPCCKLITTIFLTLVLANFAYAQQVLTPAQELEGQNKKFLALESLAHVLNLLENRYVDEKSVKSDILVEKAIKGMVNALDPHTIYLPPDELNEFQNDTSGKFGGIGIVITQNNNYLEVVEVLPDSPAQQSGIKAGDVISGIDNIAFTRKNSEEILSHMRGLVGTDVIIDILPAEVIAAEKVKNAKIDIFSLFTTKKTKKINLTREIIHTSSVSHSILSDGYVYAKISIFQEDTAESLDKALSLYEDKMGGKLQGLIIDLRGNPGGLFEQAVRICDLFLDSGIIVSTIGRNKENQSVEYATKRNTHPYMPMAVLVNERSASASEIVAGALQDHNRAIILGSTTFGKGSVQQVAQLPNGGGLKFTVARYFTPKGRSIQAKGIIPDIPIPASDKNETNKNTKEARKEADLEGHIEATDLTSQFSVEGFAADVEKWPAKYRNDAQLRIAYTYVKSWERFKNNDMPK